ncbi:MAG: HlyD family efflux transporter periplasmic adaptor subunit [Calditrichaeota bacterium]|nr:HlyD family efflux transporter periplasmic adaptor subunit [Calditrichota bacterium]
MSVRLYSERRQPVMHLHQIKIQFLRLPRWAQAAAIIGVLAVIIWILWPSDVPNVPTAAAQSGEFIIDIKETGRLRAENSVFISAPPARSNLQIIGLVDEGTLVQKGDFLIQFDTTDVRQTIDDLSAELELARSNLDHSRASIASRMANLESSLENSRASYRLSELRLEQLKFEADVRVEEGKLQLQQAKISLEQAEREIEAQTQINQADIRSLELKVRQAEIDLEKARADLQKLTITAPQPGLVVYKETWRGGEMSKIKIGDTPWRGQTLIELPDLSVMMVEMAVSELDVGRVKAGLSVEVKLEAYPDPIFNGEIMNVAILTRAQTSAAAEARMFDVLVRIKESDPLLRPGMSASARIIIERIPDKIWVPIEAVFDKSEKMVVYEQSGSGFTPRTVKLGARNDNFVVMEEGLAPNARVALIDPNAAAGATSGLKGSSKVETKTVFNNNANQSAQPSQPSRRGGQRPSRRNDR